MDTDITLQNPLASATATVGTTPLPAFQEGVRPVTFKALIGRGHAEFATMRQQDVEGFFMLLLTLLWFYTHMHPDSTGGGDDITKLEPTEMFAFAVEQHL